MTMKTDAGSEPQRNVLGLPLEVCSRAPITGFFRSGCCETGPEDRGRHIVCAVMTAEFLAYSKRAGNDLSTPVPSARFPGLKPRDRWCLCGARWKQAYDAGCAPKLLLGATHESMLDLVPLEVLMRFALDAH